MSSWFRRHTIVGLTMCLWFFASNSAVAQLRIVSYNTATASPGSGSVTARTGIDTVLEAIGAESTNGIAKPIDVLLLQEQFSMATSAQSFVDVLNDIYDPINRTMYARSVVNGGASADSIPAPNTGAGGRPGLVYNTQTVDLLGELAFGGVGGSSQARQTLRYQLRPVGYDASSDFYVYNNHYKAGTSSSDQSRRLIEATAVRNNADALGEGTNIIYAGDFNIQRSTEGMYTELLSAGNGQAFDPINTPGTWHNSSSLQFTHTQSPASSSQFSGQSTGGVDDRFDFQLATAEVLDGEGLSYISGSYHAFGNNASHGCCNNPITAGNGAASNVLTALTTASDHLPVVADYRVPAILSAQLDSIPLTVPLGASVNVDVFVENVANVISALGADELDYSVSVSGDLLGSASGIDLALGGFNSHPISLDTSTAGSRSGVITVSSDSQGALNTLVNLPVSFTVGGSGSGPVFGVIARDDFDTTLNRTAFVQSPVAGALTSPADGFQPFQVGISPTIPFALVDDSVSVFPADQQGIVDASPDSPGFKSDAWFGVTNLEGPDNPSGIATATWSFDISGASGIEVSIDMAAMGAFDASDSFVWTYSIDGNAAQDLFTSSIDDAGSATYELASGTLINLDDPLLMTDAQGGVTQLSNDFQSLTSLITGSGDTLTLELIAMTDGNASATFNSEAYAFDNIVIEGFTGADADFDQDGDVDGADFLAWQRGLDGGASLAEGDANGDMIVDEQDLAAWQTQYGVASLAQQQASTAVPEPGTAMLVFLLVPLALFSCRLSRIAIAQQQTCSVASRG